MVYARGRRTASGIFRTASLSRRFFPDSGTARASSMGDRTRDLRGSFLYCRKKYSRASRV